MSTRKSKTEDQRIAELQARIKKLEIKKQIATLKQSLKKK